MKTLILICCMAVAIVACNPSGNGLKLTGNKWVLENLDGKKVEWKEGEKEVFIQFDGEKKRVSGMAGCNRFFGEYELDGQKLKFSKMGATRMACPDLEKEAEFFKMLEATDNYAIKDHQLSLMQKNKVLAVFKGEKLPEEK